MSVTGQTLTIDQGCDARLQLSIPIGSSGFTAADITAATFALYRNRAAVLTKTLAAADIVKSDDGTNLYLDLALVPADSAGLEPGKYGFEWIATIDGEVRKRADGQATIRDTISA